MKRVLTTVAIVLLVMAGVSAQTVGVSIAPGENWKMKRNPQIAVWIEKADGTYCATLYVTQRAAKKSWKFAPKEGRPESLPVWYSKSNFASRENASQSPELDAVTSATPKGGSNISRQFNADPQETYVIKVEVNHSFDYNESWPKKAKEGDPTYSGVNGQPSIIYQGTLPQEGETTLELTGTGNVLGSDGTVYDERDKLTTALTIVKTIYVNVTK